MISRKICLLFSVLSWALSSNIAQSEILNKPDIYEGIEVCLPYSQFLQQSTLIDDASACQSIAEYIVEHRDYKQRRFLRGFQNGEVVGRHTSLAKLATGVLAVLRDQPVQAYNWLDAADRHINSSMRLIGDDERAYVYSSLIAATKIRAIQPLCGFDTEEKCANLTGFITIADVLGDSADTFGNKPPHSALYCLLRTDAFEVSIRTLTASPAFQECMN